VVKRHCEIQTASDEVMVTPVASACANGVIERFVGTLRRESLDQLIILDQQNRPSLLGESVQYYKT
jgi:hypothetical protein